MNRRLTLFLASATLLCAHHVALARDLTGVNAIPKADIARLNASLAKPSDKYDTPARIVKAYVPIYPISRYLSGRTGTCAVEMTIDVSGKATNLKPDPAADEKMCAHALYALRYWEFSPAAKAGRYAPVSFRMPFNYDLK